MSIVDTLDESTRNELNPFHFVLFHSIPFNSKCDAQVAERLKHSEDQLAVSEQRIEQLARRAEQVNSLEHQLADLQVRLEVRAFLCFLLAFELACLFTSTIHAVLFRFGRHNRLRRRRMSANTRH